MPEPDERFMRQALAEGEKGLGLTSPNPAVGAVLTRGDQVLGTGWHRKAGGPHAEVEAIRAATEAHGAEALRGATLHVTLEPCSTRGRTPPCVDAILETGLGRVIVGCPDPNPAHAGAGLDRLRERGVEVRSGVLRAEAEHLIRFFAKHIATGRPYVIAKTAMTLDGRTTLPEGHGRWISSPASREDVQRLRRQVDAILVGGETFRADNPRLTLRGDHAEGREQPLRVVLTGEQDLPQGHHLFTDEFAHRSEVFRGDSLSEALAKLGERDVTSVLLESGGRLLEHGLAEGLIDEAVFYLAPLLGGGGVRILPGEGPLAALEEVEVVRVGADVRVSGRVVGA